MLMKQTKQISGVSAGVFWVLLAGFIPTSAGAASLMHMRQLTANEPSYFADVYKSRSISGRYEAASGRQFSLTREGRSVWMKFANEANGQSLDIVNGPRGDEILKDGSGRKIVRVTHLGGVILYDSSSPNGSPASRLD